MLIVEASVKLGVGVRWEEYHPFGGVGTTYSQELLETFLVVPTAQVQLIYSPPFRALCGYKMDKITLNRLVKRLNFILSGMKRGD